MVSGWMKAIFCRVIRELAACMFSFFHSRFHEFRCARNIQMQKLLKPPTTNGDEGIKRRGGNPCKNTDKLRIREVRHIPIVSIR